MNLAVLKNEKEKVLQEREQQKEAQFNLAKQNCKECDNFGQIFWHGSYYCCTHGLSLQQRTLSNKIL